MKTLTGTDHKLGSLALVDNSHDDLYLTQFLVSQAAMGNPVVTADGGNRAIELLTRLRDGNRRVAMVFLDRHMPECDGFDVLAWMRRQPNYARTHVAMLTHSGDPADQVRAAREGATYFLQKYPSLRRMTAMISAANQALVDEGRDNSGDGNSPTGKAA